MFKANKIREFRCFTNKIITAHGVDMVSYKSRIPGFIAMALFASVVLPDSGIAADIICGKRDDVIGSIYKQQEITPVAMGISHSNKEAFEFFVSPKGVWSFIATSSKGKTCIMATGHSWRKFRNVAPVAILY